MATNPFLNTLQALGLYKNAQAPQVPMVGWGDIPPQMLDAARNQAQIGVGTQLMAAAFARDPNARANAIAGIGDAADISRPLYNMAQAKLMATPKPKETRTDVVESDGRLLLIDLNTGETIKDVGPAPAKSGGGGININMPGDEDEFQKKRAGTLATKLDTFEEGANTAPQKIGQLQTLRSILSGVEQGTFAEQKGQIVSTLQSMGAPDWAVQQLTGLDPNMPGAQQAAKKIIAEMTISQIGPGGFPAQNFSNADLQFLRESQVSLNALPEANDLRIEMGILVEQAKMDAALAWEDFKVQAAAEGMGEGEAFERFQAEYRKMLNERAKNGETYFAPLKSKIEALKKRGSAGQPGGPRQRDRQSILEQYGVTGGGSGM